MPASDFPATSPDPGQAQTAPDVWTGIYRVPESGIDRNGHTTVEQILDFLQDAGGNHADQLGCGFNELRKTGCAWVVSRLQLSVRRSPGFQDQVTVRTWPRGFRRIIAIRHTCLAIGDEEVVHASSFWALIDLASGRPLALPDALHVPLPDNEDLPEYFTLPGKLPEIECGHPMTVPVTERLLDRNAHVNNCRYAGLVTDWLGRELGGPAHVRSFTANYLSPSPPGDVLTVTGKLDGAQFQVEIAGRDRKRFAAAGELFLA